MSVNAPTCSQVGAPAATVPDETSNAAVAVGASMARAVLAAEHYRRTGAMPAWAATERTPANAG